MFPITGSVLKFVLSLTLNLTVIIAGQSGIVYRARLSRPTLRKTECEIVAVKTIKCKDTKSYASMYMSTTDIVIYLN